MGHLERLLRTTPPRCACPWSTTDGETIWWHTCTAPPGHAGAHACACGADTAQAA